MPPEESPQNDASVAANAVDSNKATRIADVWERVQERMGGISDEANAEVVANGGKVEPAEKQAEAEKPAAKAKPKEEPAAKEPEAGEPGHRDYAAAIARNRAIYERKEAKLVGDVQRREQAIGAAVAKYEPIHNAVQALVDSGDFDAFAAALAPTIGDPSIKDWNSLQQAALQSHGNPAIRETRKLRAQIEADKKARADQEQTAKQTAAQAAAQAQQKQWRDNIADEIATDEDAGLAALSEVDEEFSGYVFATQQKHWNDKEGVLPTKDAAEQTVRQLYAQLSKWNAWLETHKDSPFVKKILGAQPTAKAALGSGNRPNAARKGNGQFQKPPPNVSQNRTAEAAPSGRPSNEELRRLYIQRMEDAARDDARASGHR